MNRTKDEKRTVIVYGYVFTAISTFTEPLSIFAMRIRIRIAADALLLLAHRQGCF